MKRYLVAGLAFAGLFYCLPATAQNSGAVPQYAVPIGKGAGTTGFDSAAPGTSGWALVSNGPGAKPTFQSVAGAAFGAQNANKVFAGPASGVDALPAFRALVGADLPLPGASSLGGVKSLTATTNNFLTGLGTDGAFTRAQPAFSNLSGSATCSQLPALTGNVTTSAGSCATTIGAGVVTNSMLAGSIAASKLIGTDIATVGTVTAGTWQGTKVGLAYGGTNADLSATGGTSQFLKQNTAGGAIVPTRPTCADLSNASASCATNATDASNITAGTLPAARLPAPTASTLGGINSKDCTSGSQFVQKVGTDGSVTCATPSGGGNVSGPGSSTDNALVRFDGTTGTTVQNSQITLGDTDGKMTRSGGISISRTNTNDSAASGYVGEYNSATASSVALTTTVSANVVSLSIPAGDWDVSGFVTYSPDSTTVVRYAQSSLSTTSASIDSSPDRFAQPVLAASPGVSTGGINFTAKMGPTRMSFASATTVYLVVNASFTTSTLSASGMIRYRAIR